MAANSTRNVALVNLCGIPPGARAVALNFTVTGGSASGNLRVYPAGIALPLASAINYIANKPPTT